MGLVWLQQQCRAHHVVEIWLTWHLWSEQWWWLLVPIFMKHLFSIALKLPFFLCFVSHRCYTSVMLVGPFQNCCPNVLLRFTPHHPHHQKKNPKSNSFGRGYLLIIGKSWWDKRMNQSFLVDLVALMENCALGF